MPDKPPAPQVPAADQTLRILSFLGRQRGPVAARTIATQLEIPRSSAYHLLATLEEHGFVDHIVHRKELKEMLALLASMLTRSGTAVSQKKELTEEVV